MPDIPREPPKVLVIATAFPPTSHIGVRRVSAFVDYLPRYGWEPRIITTECIEKFSEGIYDAGLYPDELKEKVVMRLPQPGCLDRRKIVRTEAFLRSFVRAPLSSVWNMVLRPVAKWRDMTPVSLWREGKKALTYLRANPDVKAIYATSPSNASLMLASYLSEKSGLPWVADLRDDWAEILSDEPVASRVVTAREKKILANAAEVLTVSKGCADAISTRLGTPVKVIHNGFDANRWDEITEVRDPECFTVRYMGSLWPVGKSDPRPLFAAIQNMRMAGEISDDDIALEFYGSVLNCQLLDQYLEGYPDVAGMVKRMPLVPWEKSMELQRGADALLFLPHSDMKGILTGKLYEYLVAGPPVLSVLGDGDECDQILTRSGIGLICHNEGEVETALRRLYVAWREGGTSGLRRDTEYIAQFSREKLTGKLADTLNAITEAALPSPSV